MAYVVGNPKTKKALKEMIKQGRTTCFEPSFGDIPWNGIVYLEGPHYPAAHKWYASGTVKNGVLVSVK